MPLPEITEEQKKIKRCVEQALAYFNEREEYLISRDLSERCICARFAMYLQGVLNESEFCDYIVDVEYNRGNKGNEYAAKVLYGLESLRKQKNKHVNPGKTSKIVVDLIAHKRGYREDIGFDNLLCIEMKKAYKKPDLTIDSFRLTCLTNPLYGFGYKAGFMIVAVHDKNADKYCLKIDTTYFNGFPYSD